MNEEGEEEGWRSQAAVSEEDGSS